MLPYRSAPTHAHTFGSWEHSWTFLSHPEEPPVTILKLKSATDRIPTATGRIPGPKLPTRGLTDALGSFRTHHQITPRRSRCHRADRPPTTTPQLSKKLPESVAINLSFANKTFSDFLQKLIEFPDNFLFSKTTKILYFSNSVTSQILETHYNPLSSSVLK